MWLTDAAQYGPNYLSHRRALLQQAQALQSRGNRYEKHAANYLALLKLASTRISLRAYESVS
jgi:hypothetical protein